MKENKKFGVFEGVNIEGREYGLLHVCDNIILAHEFKARNNSKTLFIRELSADEILHLQPPKQQDAPTRTGANAIQHDGDHYKKMRVEVWDIVDDGPIEQAVGYYRWNAVKYLKRLGTKDEAIIEAKKALHYCQKLIEVLEGDEK
jgi:hypothetical protein